MTKILKDAECNFHEGRHTISLPLPEDVASDKRIISAIRMAIKSAYECGRRDVEDERRAIHQAIRDKIDLTSGDIDEWLKIRIIGTSLKPGASIEDAEPIVTLSDALIARRLERKYCLKVLEDCEEEYRDGYDCMACIGKAITILKDEER